ncbi:hypothetical protein ACYJW8_05140 [Frateuria aurantia]
MPAHVYYCLAIRNYGLQEYDSSRRLFNEAALWGSKQAEYVLGYMALHGEHQPVDKPRALAWFSLAAERHTAMFQQAQQDLQRLMTPSELAQSETILKDLGPRYTDAVAARRAEERYQQGMLWLDGHRRSDNICISGMITPRGAVGSASPAPAGRCPTPMQLTREINTFADAVFVDWGGHVDVGPLQQVKPPAISRQKIQ